MRKFPRSFAHSLPFLFSRRNSLIVPYVTMNTVTGKTVAGRPTIDDD